MKNCPLIFSVLLMMLVAFTVTARADGFKEGKWSETFVTKMENMPPEMAAAMKQMENMPPEVKAQMQQMQQKMGMSMSEDGTGMTMSITQCLTKNNPVPKHAKEGEMQYCQEKHEMVGNTVNFHSTCDHNDMHAESSGSIVYTGDSMQGHIKSHIVQSGKTMDSTVDITGQYLGPCP